MQICLFSIYSEKLDIFFKYGKSSIKPPKGLFLSIRFYGMVRYVVKHFGTTLLFQTKRRIDGIIISLACISSATQNLQRVFRPGGGGVVPYIGYVGMCGAKGYGFSAVLV